MSHKLEYSISGRFVKASLSVECEVQGNIVSVHAHLKNESVKLIGSKLDMSFASSWQKIGDIFAFKSYSEKQIDSSKSKEWISQEDGILFRKTNKGKTIETTFEKPNEVMDPGFLFYFLFAKRKPPEFIQLLQETGFKKVSLATENIDMGLKIFEFKETEKALKTWQAIFNIDSGKITFGEVNLGGLFGKIEIHLESDSFFPPTI